MVGGFIVGAIYFGVKALYLKEKWLLYSIVGGITTGILSWIIGLLLQLSLFSIDNQDITVEYFFLFITLTVVLYLVDKWSGLYWNVEKHNAFKKTENKPQPDFTVDEMAEIRRIRLQQGIEDEEMIFTKESTNELINWEINENWSIKVNSDFEFQVDEEGDFVLNGNENQIIISIRNSKGKTKEELYNEYKSLSYRENEEFIIEEFEFKENDEILYGYYIIEEVEKSKETLHVLTAYTFVDGEFIESKFYFVTEDQLNWVISTWKQIKYNDVD